MMIKPCGIITLTTDYGTADSYSGALKGAVLSINPSASIVDISNSIFPERIEEAAFVLAESFNFFPPGTIHVAVVDPGVGSDRRPVLLSAAGHFFVGPDNGVFSFVAENHAEDLKIVHLTNEKYFRTPVSLTFHGRDIFGPVAAHLSLGRAFSSFGNSLKTIIKLGSLKPEIKPHNHIAGRVIHVDRYGNLITNIQRGHIPPSTPLENLRIAVKGIVITKLRTHFAEASADELFAYFGSTGRLEIAVNQGSAREVLGAGFDAKVDVSFAGERGISPSFSSP